MRLFWSSLTLVFFLVLFGCTNPMMPSDGNTPADGGTVNSDGAVSTPLRPLPSSQFVYLKKLSSTSSAIYSYDWSTGKSRLIHDLDKASGSFPNIALSPDRKWIALTAGFRKTKEEIKYGTMGMHSLWKISVDGKQVIRVSLPTPKPGFGRCVVAGDCSGDDMTCNTSLQSCLYKNYTQYIQMPAWTSDQKSIWVESSAFWTNNGGDLDGAFGFFKYDVKTGKRTYFVFERGSDSPVPHPSKNYLIALHKYYGVKSHSLSPFDSTGRVVLEETDDFSFPIVSGFLRWKSDGSGFFFLGKAKWRGDEGLSILFFHLGKQSVEQIVPVVDTEDTALKRFAVSPDGKSIVLELYNSKEKTSDLYRYDTRTKRLVALTKDGKSSDPSW